MRVSILSPVRNESRFINEMIRSVQGQTHKDWELIFVDDGSVDDTAVKIAREAKDDHRIRVVDQDSRVRGKAAAFNRAFAASSGDVIVLLAGDDTLPSDSLMVRCSALNAFDPATQDAVAFFKLRTMSERRRLDGMVLPKRGASSRSGGSITLTRALACKVFPIDATLPAEDPWLSYAAVGMAAKVVESSDIVLNYRIHEGNSNPRQRGFAEMTTAMADRHRAWSSLLTAPGITLDERTSAKLRHLARVEQLRSEGSILRILSYRGLPLLDRAAFAAMASPSLFAVRSQFYRTLSGLRGR